MKKALVAILVCLSMVVHAEESPHDKTNMKKNKTNSTSITVLVVDNVAKACNAESLERGYGGFNTRGKIVDGCSFWKPMPSGQWTCTIIVDNNPTFWTLGHEFLHCLQGRFH